MNELRWILLVAGLALIAGIYAWGLRTQRRAAAPQHEWATRLEPARTVPVVRESIEAKDRMTIDETPFEQARSPGIEEFPPERASQTVPAGARREPRLEPLLDGSIEAEPPTVRIEPQLEAGPAHRVGARSEPRSEPRAEPRVEPQREAGAEQRRSAPAAEPPREPATQKIVAVRVVAAPGSQFAGERLLEALAADDFRFGRYQIFHRLDGAGRPVVSVAGLKEPGTFDPAAMPGALFRGIALFTVTPGPLPGVRAFDELIVTARALAATLGGLLQDERGAPLTVQRIGQLREEMADFERARGAPPDA
jgi:cell division protein ZipA